METVGLAQGAGEEGAAAAASAGCRLRDCLREVKNANQQKKLNHSSLAPFRFFTQFFERRASEQEDSDWEGRRRKVRSLLGVRGGAKVREACSFLLLLLGIKNNQNSLVFYSSPLPSSRSCPCPQLPPPPQPSTKQSSPGIFPAPTSLQLVDSTSPLLSTNDLLIARRTSSSPPL